MPTRPLLLLLAAGLIALVPPGSATAQAFDSEGFHKVFSCSACHGVSGNSRSDSMPIIAGLHPAYFRKQIESYAAGKRPSPEMEPYAKMVVHLGVEEVAAFFARQRMQPTTVKPDPAAVERGRAAAAQCAVCHGPEGKGDQSKGIPSLAGQPAGYLKDQMMLFKQDTRNPGDQILKAMKALMTTVPDGQYADLAAYYSSLR